MNASDAIVNADQWLWPRWFRITLISLSTLILCSCSHFAQQQPGGGVQPQQPVVRGQSNCPPGVPCDPRFAGPPRGPAMLPPPAIQPWPPLGTEFPWPREEYLLDGGDRRLPAKAHADWRIDGLDQEDTVVHYDTVDGRILVQPSNRVTIYAPRFRSVRRVVGHSTSDFTLKARGYQQKQDPLPVNRLTEVLGSKQNIQAGGELGLTQPSTGLQRNLGAELARTRTLEQIHNGYLPNESSALLRYGQITAGEMPFLAKGKTAAQTWTKDLGAQVMYDEAFATVDTQIIELGTVYVDQTDPKKPKMRIVKMASTSDARVGEVVEFTLRFDNVGDESVGNVTIVDNLTTRLEYVADSQRCSLKAEFKTAANQGDSLVVRWELAEPIEPGKGGVIRFRCKVR